MKLRRDPKPAYQDSRTEYAPLADGEKYWAPDQTEHLHDLIKRGNMVRIPLAAGTPAVPRTLR